MNNSKIKILHFISKLELGGKDKALYQLLRAFKNNDKFEVGLALGKPGGFYYDKVLELGIPIIIYNMKSGFDFRFRISIINKIKKYAIHHFHDPSPNMIIYSLLAGKRIKRIETRRGGVEYSKNLKFKKKIKVLIKKYFYHNFIDGFSGISKNSLDSLKYQYGLHDRKMFLTYNAFDVAAVKLKETCSDVKKKSNYSNEYFLIGTASHLIKWKRIDLVIHAFSRVKIENKKLLIFGTGPELEHLKNIVESLHLGNDVAFYGEVTNLPDYLQILDCFILASDQTEGWGNVIAEAMYLKVPVVIMKDNKGTQEHLFHKNTGFIAGDADDLVDLICFIKNNKEVVKKITDAGHSIIKNKYTYKNMVDQYMELYESLLKND